MPQIFVDGQEYTITEAHGAPTIGGLLTELMAALADSHKIISQVSLDGISMTEESLQRAAEQDSASIQILALKTMTYEELTKFGLERTVLLIPEVIRQVQLAAEHFRSKPLEVANRTYASCLEDLQLLVDVMNQLAMLQDGREDKVQASAQEALGHHLQKLASITDELLRAYRLTDAMVVADILTYELVGVLEEAHRSFQTQLLGLRANQNA